MKTFEIGTPVKVETPAGIVEGKIAWYYRGTAHKETDQAFYVEFYNIGNERVKVGCKFSKKTGKVYGMSKAMLPYFPYKVQL